MQREEIVKLLKSPPKPDLEGIRKILEAEPDLFNEIRLPRIKVWGMAGSTLSAASMITSKAHTERKPGVVRGFYDNWGCTRVNGKATHWNSSQGDAVKEAMKLAGVKAWQKSLPKGDPLKKVSPDLFTPGFYVNIFLNRPNYSSMGLHFNERRSWERTDDVWPHENVTGVNSTFLKKLEAGTRSARVLADHGFQNMMTIGGDSVVFIKLPGRTSLEFIRGRMRLHDLGTAARIGCNGKVRKFFIRGVEFEWGDFNSHIQDGKVAKPIPDILRVDNSEQRRVLMEMFAPEDILSGCNAVLVDKSDLGNELFRVDIGLPSRYRAGRPQAGEQEGWHSFEERALMLRYTCPSTGRVYAKFVPPFYTENGEEVGMVGADQAQAWSHHFTLEEYKSLEAQS